MSNFNGLGMNLGNLARLSSAQTRSISAENPTGAKGQGARATDGTGAQAARELGLGWKVSPSINLAPGETRTLAAVDGPGAIQHLWLVTGSNNWRRMLLRCYWDGDSEPAVEVPLGDFYCNGWGRFCQVSSLPVASNSHGGLNSYWEMPFRASARITIENLAPEEVTLYYQVNYTLTEVEPDRAYFHAQWRRNNPLPYGEVHTLLDGVSGRGHYVGTYMAWGSNNSNWWGEGEIKFYLDGDQDFPTLCGTGTEDYFGGAWGFDVPGHGYVGYTTPFLGLCQILRPDGLNQSQQRFGLYRWHVMDPIRFSTDLRVTIQGLGWRSGGRYLPLQDDIASTVFFYLDRASTARPATPTANSLEVI